MVCSPILRDVCIFFKTRIFEVLKFWGAGGFEGLEGAEGLKVGSILKEEFVRGTPHFEEEYVRLYRPATDHLKY